MAVVSELISKFSFVGSLSPQKEFNANLKTSVTLLAGVGAGLAAAAGGLFGFVASATQSADALTDFNAETGISVERTQELGFAAEMAGSSAAAMQASLAGLSKVAGDASRGLGRGRKAFEELGISVTDASGNVKTADVLFGELRESFARLGTSAGAQKSIIASLGLDPSTLQLLNATSEEVDLLVEKSRALGIVTTEQAEAAASFQDSLGIARFGVNALGQQIAVGLAPAMQKITDRFVDFLIANKDVIADGITAFSEAILVAVGFIERMAPVLAALAAGFVIAKIAAIGFSGVMGVVLSPVVLITAAIVALLLIIDDLLVAFNGGESVIRDFFLEFLGVDIVPIMQGIVDGIKWMIDAAISFLEPFFEMWGHMFDAVIKLFQGDFTGALDSVGAAFSTWIDFLQGLFTGLFDWLLGMWGSVLGFIRDGAMSILPDWAVNLINGGGSPEDLQNPAALPSGSGQDPLDVPEFTPNEALAIGGGTTTSNVSSNIDQQNSIVVYSSDPQQAGAAVNNALQEQLRTAKTQVNRGGR